MSKDNPPSVTLSHITCVLNILSQFDVFSLSSLHCVQAQSIPNALEQLVAMVRNRISNCPGCGAYSITKKQAVCVEIVIAFQKQFLN